MTWKHIGTHIHNNGIWNDMGAPLLEDRWALVWRWEGGGVLMRVYKEAVSINKIIKNTSNTIKIKWSCCCDWQLKYHQCIWISTCNTTICILSKDVTSISVIYEPLKWYPMILIIKNIIHHLSLIAKDLLLLEYL